jgi:hypothetical protein
MSDVPPLSPQASRRLKRDGSGELMDTNIFADVFGLQTRRAT